MRLWGGIMANTVGEPGHRGEHAEPTEGTHDSAAVLVLGEEPPLCEENFPVGVAGANQGQGRGARVSHVGADVREVFKEPEDGKGEASRFALPEETGGAEKRHEQFSEGSSEDHDGLTEPAEEEMPAFVDDQDRK